MNLFLSPLARKSQPTLTEHNLKLWHYIAFGSITNMTHMRLARCVQSLKSFRGVLHVLKNVLVKGGLKLWWWVPKLKRNYCYISYYKLENPNGSSVSLYFLLIIEKNYLRKIKSLIFMNYLSYSIIMEEGKTWNWGPIMKYRATSFNPSHYKSRSYLM